MKYKITVKNTEESYVIEQHQLMTELKNHFPNGNKGFYDHVYNRISGSPRTPYNNDFLRIERIDYKPTEKEIWKEEVKKNNDLERGMKINYNEWIIYNKKTKKGCTFTNLSALARELDINYSFLYNSIKFSNEFVIQDFIFTRIITLEKDYYHARVQEIM